MCTITADSHVSLDVEPADRREVARALLAAAERAGLDPANPCNLTATSAGFRVSAVVLAASDITTPATADATAEPAEPAPAGDAPAPAEAEAEAEGARGKSRPKRSRAGDK